MLFEGSTTINSLWIERQGLLSLTERQLLVYHGPNKIDFDNPCNNFWEHEDGKCPLILEAGEKTVGVLGWRRESSGVKALTSLSAYPNLITRTHMVSWVPPRVTSEHHQLCVPLTPKYRVCLLLRIAPLNLLIQLSPHLSFHQLHSLNGSQLIETKQSMWPWCFLRIWSQMTEASWNRGYNKWHNQCLSVRWG